MPLIRSGPVYSAFWYSAESVRAQQPSRLLRQGLRRTAWMPRRCAAAVFAFIIPKEAGQVTKFGKFPAEMLQMDGLDSAWAAGLSAVSYTHLDVYKRQHRRSG